MIAGVRGERLRLRTSGSLLPAAGRSERCLELDALPHAERAELIARVRELAATPSAGDAAASRIPDAVTYTVTLESPEATTVVRASDGAMSPRFAELVDRCDALLRAQRG